MIKNDENRIGIFTFITTDGIGKQKTCNCVGANNCSDITCPLVSERLDMTEKLFEKFHDDLDDLKESVKDAVQNVIDVYLVGDGGEDDS